MRVNHVGEVCAQALYQAQALTARTEDLRRQIPAIKITGSVYSDNPSQRLLLVNGLVLNQGGLARESAPDRHRRKRSEADRQARENRKRPAPAFVVDAVEARAGKAIFRREIPAPAKVGPHL